MNVISMKISDVKPYENNPRNNEEAVEPTAKSIKEFGWQGNPIIVDKNHVIIAGHTRYKAAKKLGMEEVPVVVASNLTPEQVKVLRKAMNSFFIDTHKPFKFVGRINEDVNMYCDLGSRGKRVFQVTDVMINQESTQSADNGMTSLYLDYGTYLKSFYSVMIQPSFVKLAKMGVANYRIHHNVDWNCAVPKILSQKYKKA